MSRPPPPPGAPPGPPSFRPVPPPARIIPVAVVAPVSVPIPPSVPPPPVAPTPPAPIPYSNIIRSAEPEIDTQSYHEELFDDLDNGGYDEADAQASYEELLAVDTEQMYLSDNEGDSEPQSQPAAVPKFSPPPVPNTPPPPVPPPHIVHATVPDDYEEEIPKPIVLPPGRYDPPTFSQPLPDEVETSTPLDDGADAVPSGSQVWIKDVAQVWMSVTIAGKKNREEESKVYYFRRSPSAAKEEIDFSVSPCHRLNPTLMGDMTALHHIHEPGILYNLKGRFLTQNAPYTFMASAMIAVNPLRSIQEPSMYSYVDQPSNQVAPHPFSIAESAYQNLSFSRTNQSIVISGVSGAGKTETAKIILRYLAARSPESNNMLTTTPGAKSPSSAGNSRHQAGATAPTVPVLHKVEGLDAKLVDSSPLLESFGNAKTLRNNNSSRFGKFLKLCFSNGATTAGTIPANSGKNAGMTLIGALVETYLLEKNRVITQGEGECNFHIFYILMMSHRAAGLHLKHGDEFSIVNEKSMFLFSQIKEAASMAAIESALATLGLNSAQIDGVFSILAGILHLSNIVFVEEENSEGTAAKIDSDSILHLKYAAECWGLEPHIIRNLLSKREVTTRGESYLVQYTPMEANFARDATCKSVYESLFSYIVKSVNRSLATATGGSSSANPTIDLSSAYFIGVLDIFGFENFTHNSFEQLLINYANEALQNTFNEQLFEKELQLFREENIDFSVSDCPTNKACVNLIAGRNNSIFKTLDSVSRQPKPSDERFCEELHKAYSLDKHFLGVHRKDMRSKFCIKHYAGDVTYNISSTSSAINSSNTGSTSTSGWISKNNDSVPDALVYLFTESKLPEFKALNGLNQSSTSVDLNTTANNIPARRKSVMMRPTIVAIFSKSMDDLNALLLSTSCQFVRCIKPNEAMLPGEFNNCYVMEQIRSLGILQACEVLKVSLPTRVSYATLKASLADVIKKVQHLFTGDSEVVLIACLLRAFSISPELYRLGRTMVFFRPGQLARLENILHRNNSSTGANGKEQANSDLIKAIEQSHAVNQKGLQITRKLEITLSETILQVTELDKKFDRLNQKSRNIPEVRSLDIPDDVVQKITLINSFLSTTQRKHQQLMIKLMSLTATVEDVNVNMSEENRSELARQAKVCASEVSELERLLVEAQQGFASVNEQISLLEEQCGGISSVFNDCVERNDQLYEKIQEDRNNYEVTTIKAREQAERCQLDRVEHYAAQCADLHKSMLNNMNELQKGINCALVEIEKFEGAGDDVDFSKVSSLAVSIVNKLDHTQRGLVNTEGTIAQLERSVKTARAGSTISGVPPPRPSITAPVGNNNNSSNNGEENEADRRASVNFSARDLTLLRQKKKQEEAAAAKASAAQQGLALMQELDVAAAGNEDSNALPPDWIEKTDKKSGRLYYVNEVTKARQWKRPVRDPINIPASSQNEDEDRDDTDALPAGWKELIDKKTGRAYYVNSETKEKQWRRPTNERVKSLRLAGSPTKAADQGSVMEQIKASNRLSRRLKAKVAPSYLVEGEGASLTARSAAKVAAARRSSMKLLESETVDEKYRNTVSYMCRVGGETKKGFLLKQGKFIGRWKRRHFVLTDDLLEYWDRVQDHALGKDGKTFFLSGSCQTAYTSTQNCFCVSNPTDPDESNSWYLLADSESDMLDWMSAINAHIHMRYLAEWHITTDFWERGNVETTFWKMPASALKGVQRRPVGIRSLPINDGPRTGEGVYPGEIVEVVQILEQPADTHVWAQRFLRLSDDRGWVVENHPKANYAIMVPVSGQLVEDETLRYVYSADCLEDLEVYNSPNCDEDHLTGLTLHPGSIIRAVAAWTTTTRDVSAVIEPNEDGSYDEGEYEELTFVKMADGLGWVPVYHPITGGQILSLVSQKSTVAPVQTGIVHSNSSAVAPKLTRTPSMLVENAGMGNNSSASNNSNKSKVSSASAEGGKSARPPPPVAEASTVSNNTVSFSAKGSAASTGAGTGSSTKVKSKATTESEVTTESKVKETSGVASSVKVKKTSSTATTGSGEKVKAKDESGPSVEKKSSKTSSSSSSNNVSSKNNAPLVAPTVSVVSSRLTTKLPSSAALTSPPPPPPSAEAAADKPRRRPIKEK